MKILTTGAGSGMGRYIYEHLGGIGITRGTSAVEMENIRKDGVDVIIHCAFNSGKNITADSLFGYFNDNVLLTKDLISIPHKKFIYFSTVDLYARTPNIHMEDEIIYPDKVNGIYATAKLISESIVRKYCTGYMILRPTTLVGTYSRKNTLFKIIEGDKNSLYLSENSRFNYVLYPDILEFIKLAIERDLSGVYNVASSENILLSEVAVVLDRKVSFGDHLYDVGNISNDRIAFVYPAFKKTSKDVLNEFIKEYARA